MFGNLGLVFAGVLIVLAVSAVTFAVWNWINPSRTAIDRLRDMAEDTGRPRVRDPAVEKIAERLATLAKPSSEEDQNRQKLRLIQAGYRGRHAPEVFNIIRVGAALLLPVLLGVPLAGQVSLLGVAVVVLTMGAAGYYAPQLIVSNAITKRQKLLMGAFPDALDLLVSSVEAGLGLDAAFRRVADEMEAASPELAREFQMVNSEISAGVSRVDALRHLEQRTGLDSVKSLVNMLTQAERFGTSIARSLRIHSSIAREKRMAAAEEEAAKVSPKLTVIMILFLLPVLMVVLLGPAAINIKTQFLDKE